MALQPQGYAHYAYPHLQQQKLLWHYSPKRGHDADIHIYNSRNYYGIIACYDSETNRSASTIVEIIMALQPTHAIFVKFFLSTIVEIIMALQPLGVDDSRRLYIYNSRNYYGIIAKYRILLLCTQSTIVEIIMALQPFEEVRQRYI